MSRRLANGLGFLACVALMGYALYAQHVLGLAPCPLCIFQRVAVIAVGAVFLIAALHDPGTLGARIYGGLILLTAACGADLDFLLDIMPITQVITKVLTGSGECGKIDWTFLGLSMPWWVLISLATLGAWGAIVNFRRIGRAR